MSIEGYIDVPLGKSDVALTAVDGITYAATGIVFMSHFTGKPWIEKQ
jgi:hypothetical protein